MNYSVFEDFCKEIGVEIVCGEPMAPHSGFKTGGKADLFLKPSDTDCLSEVLETANALNIPTLILGNGSNLLVSDKGIEGAVISLAALNEITVDGEYITAGAGASLTAVCVAAQKAGLSGLEFAYGIPGTVGGGLFMNAGAYGGEFSDVVESARYVTSQGESGSILKENMDLGYRHSVFKSCGKVITSVTFKLSLGDKREIKEAMDCLMEKRRTKQPLEYPSCGSTFKRPTGYFAGALIEGNGLKGAAVGGAQVSEKHAGFIINRENATTEDILKLMDKVKQTVLEKNGVELEPEVIFVGRN